jgi:hypothetical protein
MNDSLEKLPRTEVRVSVIAGILDPTATLEDWIRVTVAAGE